MSDKPNADVLVLGGGLAGAEVAERISQAGYKVAIATDRETVGSSSKTDAGSPDRFLEKWKADRSVEIWTDATLLQAGGFVGDFKVTLQRADGTDERSFGAIVAATDMRTESLKEKYGLEGRKEVLSLDELERLLISGSQDLEGRRVAFAHGLLSETNPLEFDRLLNAVSKLQDSDSRVFVFADNLKLTAFPLDRKYHEARKRGAIFLKSPDKPEFSIGGDPLRIEFLDSALGRKVELQPDLLVVDRDYLPDERNGSLAEKLGINLSGNGYLQAENVHNLTVRTNRRGVFVVGGGKQLQSPEDSIADADNVVHELDRLFKLPAADGETSVAEVDPEKCVICLTCYRACQHRAIAWVEGVAKVYERACLGCGMCASECPMNAIQVRSYSDRTLCESIEQAAAKEDTLIVFCCENSAVAAREAALKQGFDLASGLEIVELPCAGKLDTELIMHALTSGASGVLALGCHPGNCRSEKGSLFAKQRMEEFQRTLEAIGMQKERVQFGTLAGNMGSAFRNLTAQMAKTIRQLGPSPFQN